MDHGLKLRLSRMAYKIITSKTEQKNDGYIHDLQLYILPLNTSGALCICFAFLFNVIELCIYLKSRSRSQKLQCCTIGTRANVCWF